MTIPFLHNTINVEVPDAGIFLTQYICKKNEVTQTIQIGQDLSTDKADSRREKLQTLNCLKFP